MEDNGTTLIGTLVQPQTLGMVAEQDVRQYQVNGLLNIPAGPVAACVSSIERFRRDNAPKEVLAHLLRMFGHFARFALDYNWISLPFDLFVIENEGSIASFPVKRTLGKYIDAQANVLIDRHFQQHGNGQYQYGVRRPSIGPRFGEGTKPVLFIDPTLATGGSILAALNWLTEQGIKIPLGRVHVWTMAAAPLGIQLLCSQGVHIVTGKLASGVNTQGYIIDNQGNEYIGDMSQLLAQV